MFSNHKPANKNKLQEICETCHKHISPAGSLTGWIFQEERCRCKLANEVRPSDPPRQHTEDETVVSAADVIDLGARYEVQSVIGTGGMGSVFKVYDRELETLFAVKALHKQLAQDQRVVRRFAQEAETAIGLTHPNLGAVYFHGHAKDGVPYLVMDLIDGQSLAGLLQKEIYLDSRRALDIIIQICEALIYAHKKGIVHRDLKPNNILLSAGDHAEDVVKIVDFGIAKILPTTGSAGEALTQTGDIFGTPLYMSPEQCKGEAITAQSDIYSLGCLFYEMLSGKAAFAAENPVKTILKHLQSQPEPLSKMGMDIAPNFELIVNRCIEKDTSLRYASAAQLLTDLEAVRDGMPPKFAAKSRSAKTVRQKILWYSIAAILTPLVAMFALYLVYPGDYFRIMEPFVPSLEAVGVWPKSTDEKFVEKLIAQPNPAYIDLTGISSGPSTRYHPATWQFLSEHVELLRETRSAQILVENVDWSLLDHMPNLEDLTLDTRCYKEIDLDCMRHAAQLKHLGVLIIGIKMQPASFRELASMKSLRVLILRESNIRNADLSYLYQMESLDRLDLADARISAEGLKGLPRLKNLTFLRLAGCMVGDTGSLYLSQMSSLKDLDLSSADLSKEALRALAKMKNLQRLTLTGNHLSNSDINSLRAQLPKTKIEWSAP